MGFLGSAVTGRRGLAGLLSTIILSFTYYKGNNRKHNSIGTCIKQGTSTFSSVIYLFYIFSSDHVYVIKIFAIKCTSNGYQSVK